MIINPLGKDIVKVSTDWCGKELSLEVNRVGFKTTASVLARYGDTVVLGTVMVGGVNPNLDYFPLSIDYEEKFYAAGKISGSRFIKREGRPSDQAILSGRIIDRPIRPLFPKGYRNEVQVVASVLSMDPNFRPDMVAMVAASAALTISGAPFDGPVAGLRVAYVDGQFVGFPNIKQQASSSIDLTVAGIKSGVTMVEAGANEVPETLLADAFAWAYDQIQPAIDLQQQLADKLNVVPLAYDLVKPDETIAKQVANWCEGKLTADLRQPYPKRNQLIEALSQEMNQFFEAELGEEAYAEVKNEYNEAFTLEVHKDVRKGIIEDGVRPDGRKLDEVRPLSSEVGVLPRAHGSSIFTRGMTQALNIVTLAPMSYAQIVDTMEVTDGERRYMHHYNAPGYTVGEVRRLGSPGRREIGHGYLAERALEPVLPSKEDFPYAIRSVTEIMSQGGSTSMAATCSSCLALMDAGVPLKRPVSGVAMGLMMDGETPYILTDIADAEDFAGDMDFKSTGTERGVTALQMDMKVHGLPVEVLRKAILRAKEGRDFIMNHMLSILSTPKKELSKYAPRIEKIKINPDKIGAVIGKGGETIREITSQTGAEIDIEDDGSVTIASSNANSITKALDWIKRLTVEPEVGTIYTGKVVSIKEFGAFVSILPDVDGLVHISELANGRTEKVEDVVKMGQEVKVKLVSIDEKGRLKLSMRDIEQ